MKSTSSIWDDFESKVSHFYDRKCLSSRLKAETAKVTMNRGRVEVRMLLEEHICFFRTWIDPKMSELGGKEMQERLVESVERAINQLVTAFQGNRNRFWNERDMHWSLFYCLKQEGAIQENYATQLIRAEFPTVKKFGEKSPARGHYDLAVLDPESYSSAPVQSMKAQDPWDEYLKLVKVIIAVEIKLWLARLPCVRADWDIQKLTQSQNNVQNAYFLNFVQLDFSRPRMKEYYRELRGYLMDRKRQWPDLKILCVPSETKIQPEPSENWLSPS